MNKFLFALLAGCIPVLVATNEAYAQNSASTEVSAPQPQVEKTAITQKDRSAEISGVNSNALKNFSKAYKNVAGESWEKISDGFAAKFNSDGVRNVVYFLNNGNWSGSLKGYNENKMPADVRKIVKREYYDYTITYVQEAETLDSKGIPTYIVHLEDSKSIKQVRIYNGEMEVWKEYKKPS